ncbi:potassium transporter Kup [Roseomonas sp. KE2513]|uniref:potassium transporter Kup n=1 Tax=Roseomonas sp. KE2513 TaxID=2479202 RepID=UPI0018E060AB|nr:potassium transporter Kup [Roseomonas sp. KE2513]MBI0537093.1 potassium transporter Kup [Roseomonas sp. KE2513]
MPDSNASSPPTAAVSTPAAAAHPAGAALLLGALGVVFGDIGTSPIYAMRETLRAASGEGAAAPAAIYGVVSLIFWAVTLVVATKYVVLVMRADNQGEGGTMALISLAIPVAPERLRLGFLVVGLAGASLFFGDAMITPAISVLSAVEGLSVATPVFTPYVVPIAAAVLVGLFAIQSRGSAKMGRLFGPVMAAWFAVLALAGLLHVIARPEVLAALDPRHAIRFLTGNPGQGALAVLGSAFLALTGGEALYADMGHFGRHAIRVDWFVLVMPALVLNYLGQAALVLGDPAAAENPFFGLFPGPLLYLAVVLATAATVIASQAVISGAFALVQQAIQLGAVPRLEVRQTSEETAGQVYLPLINWLLAAAVLALVFGFRNSESLANAYGIAVAGDMMVTTILLSLVARGRWKLPWLAVALVAVPFLLLDLVFVAGNLHKIPAGGWFPLLVGAVCLAMMLIWRRGRAVLLARRDEGAQTLELFLGGLDAADAPLRVPGTAIYLTGQREVVPAAMALNMRHNGVLHERVVLMHVVAERVPRIPEAERVSVHLLPGGFRHVTLRFGFAEKPDVPQALRLHRETIGFSPEEASYFIGNEVPVPSMRPDLPIWQEHIFAFLTRNAVRAPDYFLIPPPRVVELGTRVEL